MLLSFFLLYILLQTYAFHKLPWFFFSLCLDALDSLYIKSLLRKLSWGHVTFCNLDLSSSVSTACSLLCPLLWWMTNEYLNLCSLFPVSFMLPLILLCLSCLVWWHCLVQEYTGKNIVRTHNWNHIQVMICLENFKVLDSVFL